MTTARRTQQLEEAQDIWVAVVPVTLALFLYQSTISMMNFLCDDLL